VKRAVPAACVAAVLLVAGCGGGTKTVTKTQTQAQTPATPPQTTVSTPVTTPQGTTTAATATVPRPSPGGNHGPHYFETPSHNIGCYVSAHDARCDIRKRSWTPPPEPQACIKFGLDYGQGLVVGPHRAEVVCAGDTTLGGPVVLGYGHSTQRGSIVCASASTGVTCTNGANGHGFFLSRATYRLF
jgi:hypothetical protein